jgi:Protein kinase domain
MWRLVTAPYFRRKFSSNAPTTTTAAAVVAAVTTTASLAFLWQQQQQQEEERNQKEGEEERGVAQQSPHPWMTQCESASVTGGTMQFRTSRLRRHSTIQKMEILAENDRLEARYEIDWKQPLGEGTFGKVFKGVDRRTGERVAVKQIFKKLTDNESFQREMEALLRVRQARGHPNICGMRENFDEGEYYYLVLDLIDGGELFDYLIEQGAFSEYEASRLVREVASALAFMVRPNGTMSGAFCCVCESFFVTDFDR